MAQRTFQVTDEAANTLMAAYHQTKGGLHRTRLQAVRLYGLGYALTEVQIITGCARSSLMEWCRAYLEHGLVGLNDHRRGGNSAKLTSDQRADLGRKLHQYTPRSLFGPEAATPDGQAWTVPDLRRAVAYWYDVTYQSVVSYYSLFDQCGFNYHRPTKVFRSRSERAVLEFETQLEKNSSMWPKTRRRRSFWRKTKHRCTCKRRRWRCGGRVVKPSRCGVIRVARKPTFMAR